MPELLDQIATATVALAFAWAALAKLADRARWQRTLERYGLSQPARRAAGWGVPAAELSIAGLALISPAVAAALALATLATFSALLLARRGGQKRVPCGCFGGGGERDYRILLARNACLGALAGLLLTGDGSRPLDGLHAPTGGEVGAAALLISGVVLAVWTAREALAPRR
jgi:methylamine utilization protein MauE